MFEAAKPADLFRARGLLCYSGSLMFSIWQGQ